MAMEDLRSLLGYQENVEELKQKLLCMTYELQSARMQADEEVRKNKETKESMKQLLQLLHVAHKERDEYREQLQKLLLNKLGSTVDGAPPMLSPENPLLNNNQGWTSSGITESNSLSDTTTYNNSGNPQNSSAGDSLYDVVSPVAAAATAADSGDMGFAQHSTPVVQDFSTPLSAAAGRTVDQESEIIYNLAKGRPLPQKGNLLQAVMDAGLLLQTLMVAGPLPQWRNPPPVQPLQVPPVAIGGFDGNNNNKKQSWTETETGSHLLKTPLTNLVSGFAKLPCGSSQVLTDSLLNFTGAGGFGTAELCLSNTRGLVSPAGGGFGSQMVPTPKRQRIQ